MWKINLTERNNEHKQTKMAVYEQINITEVIKTEKTQINVSVYGS